MNFEFDETLQDVKELAYEFGSKTLHPLVGEWDRNPELRVPNEIIRQMGDLGFLGLVIPEEYGGSNLGFKALAIACEEITHASKAGITQSLISASNCAFTDPFISFGTEDQKKKYVPGIVSGRLQGAMGITEPTGSSAASNLKTKAIHDGNQYIIQTGQKIFITRADTADFVLVIADSPEGAVCLIVPAGTPGMEIGPSEAKMGLRGLGLNPLYFNECVVPEENLIGKPGEGLKIAIASLYGVRTCVAAGACGMAQGAIDIAIEYAKERDLKGHKLSSFQNTQFVLAEAQTKVDAARLLTMRAADALDKGTHEYYMSSMAKWYATETCGQVVDKCLQIFGGYGFCKDYEIERMYRDVRVNRILDGATEVHKRLISKYMGVR